MSSSHWRIWILGLLTITAACSVQYESGQLDSELVSVSYRRGVFDGSKGEISFGELTIEPKAGCFEDLRIEYMQPTGGSMLVHQAPGKFVRYHRRGARFRVGPEAAEQRYATFRILAKDCKTKKLSVLSTFTATQDGIQRLQSGKAVTLRFGGSERRPHIVSVRRDTDRTRILEIRDLRDLDGDPLRHAYPGISEKGDLLGAILLVAGKPFAVLPGASTTLRVPRMPQLKAKVEVITFDRQLRPGVRTEIGALLR